LGRQRGHPQVRSQNSRRAGCLDESLDRILVAVKAHLEHILNISDYAKAATRNGRQLPERMQARQLAEQAEYSHIWRSLLAGAAAAGQLREDLDLFAARMLILGALNWAPDWWDVNRGSLESLIHTAQDMVCHATVTGPAPTGAGTPRRAAN
jgi:hypothetical protein